MEPKMDIEQLLKDGYMIQLNPEGYSMYPLFVPGRDMVVIEPFQADCDTPEGLRNKKNVSGRVRRGEVVLYRRDQGILVLHRVFKAKKEGLYLVGDNQTQVEGPLRYDQVRGKMVGFIRNGRKISVNHPVYQIYSRIWLRLRPVRRQVAVWVHAVKQKAVGENGRKEK